MPWEQYLPVLDFRSLSLWPQNWMFWQYCHLLSHVHHPLSPQLSCLTHLTLECLVWASEVLSGIWIWETNLNTLQRWAHYTIPHPQHCGNTGLLRYMDFRSPAPNQPGSEVLDNETNWQEGFRIYVFSYILTYACSNRTYMYIHTILWAYLLTWFNVGSVTLLEYTRDWTSKYLKLQAWPFSGATLIKRSSTVCKSGFHEVGP